MRGIRTAAAFTAWLDHEDLGLAELAQADLDRYLTEHPTKHRGTRAFARWAISRRLTDKRRPLPRAGPSPATSWTPTNSTPSSHAA
ncbi:hypothetical protein [Streptomyces sp. NPDC055107]